MIMSPPALSQLTTHPVHFPDTCPAISRPLIDLLLARLTLHPGPVLSVGCGHGLLESLLLQACNMDRHRLDLYGVEVRSCSNRYLPSSRYLHVPSTTSIHPDILMTSALIFVYPRHPNLVANYLESAPPGGLNLLVWLSHRTDWSDYEATISRFFHHIELLDPPGVAPYERLVFASVSKSSCEAPRV